MRSSPEWGSALSMEFAEVSLSLSLCPFPPHALSQMNNKKKKSKRTVLKELPGWRTRSDLGRVVSLGRAWKAPRPFPIYLALCISSVRMFSCIFVLSFYNKLVIW